MKKLNKNRQQMYLDGKVGLINDGTVEQFNEVTYGQGWEGNAKYYHGEWAHDYPQNGIEHKPIKWFYEEESELPKVGEWWECIEDVVMNTSETTFIKGKKYLCESDNCLTNEDGDTNHCMGDLEFTNKHFIKSTAPDQQPTAWKLNVDVPEWGLESGITGRTIGDLVPFQDNNKQPCLLPISILQHIATPIYHTPFTLENGTTINLTAKDIQNIKKL